MIARLALVIDLAGWALVLQPGGVFVRSHNYDHLARWASEPQWGAMFGLTAAVCLLGSLCANRGLRVAGAALACAMQTAIAVSFGGGIALGTGFGAYIGLAALGIWLVWRELVA